ncbi:MAG: hypothetical protein HKO81_00190 [Flavobacteriaceae bacterium]|nr:hypothetical protein [Flavobacteriaceae bacterium]
MKYFKYTFSFVLLLFLTSCKQNPQLSEYKYMKREFEFNCKYNNMNLLKEAVIAFEHDITDYYIVSQRKNLAQAYGRTMRYALNSRIKYEEFISRHTWDIFNILKLDRKLWNTNGQNASLNYDHEIVKCLADNITNKDLKTTFNALLSTGSMSKELFGEPLRRKSAQAIFDKHMATYIALDIFYAGLFNVDPIVLEESIVKRENKK